MLGIVLIVVSVTAKWGIVPPVVSSIVWSMMKLTEGTLGYDVRPLISRSCLSLK